MQFFAVIFNYVVKHNITVTSFLRPGAVVKEKLHVCLIDSNHMLSSKFSYVKVGGNMLFVEWFGHDES